MGNQGHRMRFESVKLKAINPEINHQLMVLSSTLPDFNVRQHER
jgi:hypothetical protein